MKPILTFVAAILTTIVASSCKKDDLATLQAHSTYYRTGIEKSGEIRVFAQAGEIKSQVILDRFAANDSDWLDGLAQYAFPNQSRMDSIEMTDSYHARISEYNIYYDYAVQQIGANIFFHGKDTVDLYNSGDVFSKTLDYYISLHKPPVYREYIVSSTRGNYLFGYTTQWQCLLSRRKGRLTAPWIIVLEFPSGGYFTAHYVQNKLDSGFYKWLEPADTVVLREYSVIYEK